MAAICRTTAVPTADTTSNRLTGSETLEYAIMRHQSTEKDRRLAEWALRDAQARCGLERFWQMAYPGRRLELRNP
jgi:Predicted oxidoreductase